MLNDGHIIYPPHISIYNVEHKLSNSVQLWQFSFVIRIVHWINNDNWCQHVGLQVIEKNSSTIQNIFKVIVVKQQTNVILVRGKS